MSKNTGGPAFPEDGERGYAIARRHAQGAREMTKDQREFKYEVLFLCWLILASVTDQKWLSLICAAIACGYSLLGLLSVFRGMKK